MATLFLSMASPCFVKCLFGKLEFSCPDVNASKQLYVINKLSLWVFSQLHCMQKWASSLLPKFQSPWSHFQVARSFHFLRSCGFLGIVLVFTSDQQCYGVLPLSISCHNFVQWRTFACSLLCIILFLCSLQIFLDITNIIVVDLNFAGNICSVYICIAYIVNLL